MKKCLPGNGAAVNCRYAAPRKIPKMPLLFLLLLPCIVLSTASLGQQRTITGTVTNTETRQPLAGVSVTVSGTQRGAQTDNAGRFSISAATGNTLVFSYVGYQNIEQKVGSQNNLSIALTANTAGLEEVIVIGYGTQKKKDLTGAVATVTEKNFQKGIITTPEQMIAGKVAGVSVISNSGAPGAGSTIRIRGGSSLSASNDPLIVIDGVLLENSGISGSPNSLSMVNSNDIESFTVLKDASAAAIYGTRASNGVILITTKKATGGKLKVNFSSVNSISTLTKKVDVLSAAQFRSIVNANGTTAQKAMLGTAETDWQDEIYHNAFSTDNNISLSGGIKKLPYRFSLGYLNQDGLLETGYMRRFSASLAVSPSFFDNHLKVDLNIKATTQETRFANQGAIGGAVSFDPTHPVTVNSPRFGGYYEWLDPATTTGLTNLAGRNPVGLLNQRVDKGTPQRSIGNLQLDYKFHFLSELRANLNLGYDVSKGTGTVYVSDSAASNYLAGGKGGLNNQYKQTKSNTLLDFYLNYAKELTGIHSRIDIMGGYSYYDYLTTNYNYPSYYANGTIDPTTVPNFPYDKPENTLISYFGRLNYSYKSKYLLTATVRRDGSSRFSEDNRWALFPSVALAWNMKEDLFAKNNTISQLKLRIGYGSTGQQDGGAVGNYSYMSSYALSQSNASYQFGSAYYQMYRPSGYNPNLKWEQTATTNIAVDFGLFNGRLNGSLDLYHRKTTNLLNSIPQPAGTNFSAFIIANVGDMENKGVEFSLNGQVISKKDFTWDASFNVTYNKNTINNLTVVPQDLNYVGFPSGGIAGGIGGQFALINSVGYSKNTFFLYKQVYDKAGKPVEGVFEDLNKDGIINQNDLYRGKRTDPQVFMGFTSGFTYKKWNAGFVLRAAFDNYVYNNNYSQTGTKNQILGNSVLYNASTSYLETNFVGNSLELLSDYYIQNATFLRMDNLTIGYDVGSIFKNKARLRLNGSVQNVFVVTNYKGLDPELSGGIDNNIYPRPRIYALGVNLDF